MSCEGESQKNCKQIRNYSAMSETSGAGIG